MKNKKLLAINTIVQFLTILIFAVSSFAQTKTETMTIQANDLDLKSIKPGNYSYLVYTKKNKQSGAENLFIANIAIEAKQYNGKSAFAITQIWEKAEIPFHKAYTVLSATDGSTLYHETYWEQTGMTLKFDFDKKTVNFEGEPTEAFKPRLEQFKKKTETDFQNSFAAYSLNWHSDLIIFPMLPYKENRTIKVNFYDPGSSEAQIADYIVTGSETINGSAGEKVECWTVEHRSEKYKSVQKFWISKKTKEVLKEEDSFNNTYRFKIKLKTTESN